MQPQSDAAIDLYCLPLGGRRTVRTANGNVFDAAAAWLSLEIAATSTNRRCRCTCPKDGS